MLPVLYALLLIWQIAWLVSAIRTRRGWVRLLVLDFLSTALAFGLMWYFDTLPGYGLMPGWAYFSEVFYSLAAGGVFAVMAAISVLFAVIRRKK